ncbi:MAG: hypothetical protein M0D54_04710 [Hyphomonadaceae bacterium JAD_PAG50586_4]|nr:MAG: hypothetical protein M0D54_04710 [Hyphomonadaceae bacterium JAD_PAG50586_4]
MMAWICFVVQPASASRAAAVFRKPCAERLGNPAASQASRNQLPKVSDLNAAPRNVVKKVAPTIGVASSIAFRLGWIGIIKSAPVFPCTR